MLDHHYAVPLVAQGGEAGEQSIGIARVQAGRRLVEDVADADQSGADLRGKADPLELAAGERVGPPVESQVAQADTVEERQPGGNLADQGGADQVLRRREVERLEPAAPAGGDGQRRRPRGSLGPRS